MLRSSRLLLAPCLLALMAALGACSDAPARPAAPAAPPPATAPPPAPTRPSTAELLRRFRTGLAEPAGLSGGARSREALVRRFVRAVEQHDTAALRAMVVSRAEFAYLVYPHTRYTRPPYELQPDVLWFLMQQNSEKGIVRVLRRAGGESFGLRGFHCPEAPVQEGPNRLWNGCLLQRAAAADAEPRAMRYFGPIIERDGAFKLLSYSNDF